MSKTDFASQDEMREYFLEGQVLLVDKPYEWTSFDVVNKIRYTLKRTLGVKRIKVGHAGTLDPLATGLLLICTGKFTKKIEELQAAMKTYTGTFTMGATTPSYDLESEVDATFPTDHIDDDLLNQAVEGLTGTISQTPPAFSAMKVDGKRAYKKARRGEEVNIPAREITIYRFELTRTDLPELDFLIACSKGTYIRTMAYDFGKACNSGAYLSALRRTKIGDFDVSDAMDVKAWTDAMFDCYRTITAKEG